MGIREMVLDKAKKEGKQKGKEEAKSEFVIRLLSMNQFTNAEIARMVDVPETCVQTLTKC